MSNKELCTVKLYCLGGIQCCGEHKSIFIVINFFFNTFIFIIIIGPFENQENCNFLYFIVIGKN